MSTVTAELKRVEILPHPNADRLELARIGGEAGFVSVVGKGQFKNGDLCLYIPPDAVLPQNIMDSLAKNKINMKSNRLRAVKIRGIVSEGLCLTPKDWLPDELIFEGSDVTEYLGIKKYEPPPPKFRLIRGGKGFYVNENFKKYTDIERIQKVPNIFSNCAEVTVSVKMHGTNFRCGVVPKQLLTWKDKFLKLFGVRPMEFLVGSHNTIRVGGESIYEDIAKKEELEEICWAYYKHTGKSIIIFGEIIGPGIQKSYDYGLEEHELVIFDVLVDGRYLPWDELSHLVEAWGLQLAEEVYRGPWDFSSISKMAESIDEYNGKKYVREGVVVKCVEGNCRASCYGIRSIAKIINPEYLLNKYNTEFH